MSDNPYLPPQASQPPDREDHPAPKRAISSVQRMMIGSFGVGYLLLGVYVVERSAFNWLFAAQGVIIGLMGWCVMWYALLSKH